ncbi:MAG: pirin family protein [Ilumatobacter sp.]|uniref:pirin family protein n=1 Tax=Ilumatobacter sp. TaxID=1967498 RepID=UPI003C7752F9
MTTTTTLRPVDRVVTAHRQEEGGGFVVRRPFPTAGADHFDPFLLLDELGPVEYGPGEAIGAPQHPHRGFETVTYMLHGAMEHRDSTGGVGVIRPGAVQWMTAGSGIIHSEMPTDDMTRRGGLNHGFQIWVNLPAADKMTAPRYQGFEAEEFTRVALPGGGMLRVLAGTIAGHAGPVETSIPITYGHATLAPGDAVEWEVADGETALAHVFDGAADVSGTSARSGQLVVHERSSGVVRVSVPADGEGAEILLLGGRPIDEPIARHGPFVMNTREEIVQAVDDFNAGRLGSIPAVGSGVSRP